MHFRLLSCLVKGHSDQLFAHVDAFNLANNTKFVEIETNTLLLSLQLALTVVAHTQVKAAQRMLRVTLSHQHGKGQNIRSIFVGLVEAAGVVVKHYVLNFVASDQNIHFRHWAENADLR